MDFPLFYLDFIGNRLLMAAVAITHVMINHPMAVGAWPLVALLEWWGRRRGDLDLDALAYKITFVLFIITTTFGALTGVGIWLTAALIAPFGIGSLIRVFFWAWFIEWLVFISEVGLVIVYFLMWQRWREGRWKALHNAVGAVLAVGSWLTMAIIVAILGFMMGTGSWAADRSFFSAVFNPLYLPQLVFRTGLAMVTAGFTVWFLTFFFTRTRPELRRRVVRIVSGWVLAWTPVVLIGAVWYWRRVPAPMAANLDVAFLTQRLTQWYDTFLYVVAAVLALTVLIALAGLARPALIPRAVLVIPFLLGLYTLGHFERVREFIRKPHVVADYMYSNGVTMSELPIFQRDGILTYSAYSTVRQVTSANKVDAGRDVYMLACSRCHTVSGVNSVLTRFRNLYGDTPWDPAVLSSFIAVMHNTRTFMPPFPGAPAEADALAAYLRDLQERPRGLPGAQAVGYSPRAAAAAAGPGQ
ncbi:MAG TPA: c-type cytochrome [candidate division Zixibacteria bacterium]|nr:c-type cytochrome [candidate division Zixibacteria bacterium]MDD4916795.1 c-type cytochrome [candidate division Zixibacteria bacterium]MDM7973124.1 c-type cytochrome [candidate division Zixibacteria bacterium]HOD65203.1 c-type cytochrome [candidate division Zixibacteria bacterium]HPC10947.1 c-type cytochrome [candidate division Zixibacteria bacterium]